MILAIKTDVPQAEVYVVNEGRICAQKQWQAHRQLLETIHKAIQDVLQQSDKQLAELEGVIFYEGPGSFTGLRIGCSVANALATSYSAPIIATTGTNWLSDGQQALSAGKGAQTVEPNYGQEPRITTPA